MQLDLRKSSKLLMKHLAQRVRNYPEYINEGPGKDNDPIKQITVGYQFDQAGWVAVVFDTRPRAKNDGEWNSYIEPNAIDFSDWHQAFNELVENGSPIKVTLPNGTKRTFGDGTTEEQFAECIGTMIRDALVAARDPGKFARLPLATDCNYLIEEHDGNYGWSSRDEEDPTSSRFYLAQLDGDVSSKTTDGQIAHWITVLERIASGVGQESGWSFLAPDHAIERLEALGDAAIIPLLKFVRKWANKPEFDGDRPKRKINESPMHTPVCAALLWIRDSSHNSSEVETILCEIVRKSVEANSGRKLWGIIPVFAARCLSKLFDTYPEPKQGGNTNELLNREEFMKSRRTKRST